MATQIDPDKIPIFKWALLTLESIIDGLLQDNTEQSGTLHECRWPANHKYSNPEIVVRAML